MKRLRRRFGPLATDTISPLNLPPVRWPLLTKLNLLTFLLILVTAAATTGFYLWQRWRVDESELRSQGSTVLAMLAEMSQEGLSNADRVRLEAVLDNLEAGGDFAYVAVLDPARKAILDRRFVDSLRDVALPAIANGTVPAPGTFRSSDVVIQGRRYIDLITRVASAAPDAPAVMAPRGEADPPGDVAGAAPLARVPVGFIRIGMTFERQQAQFRKTLIGALTVVALLVVMAIGATLMLTRRLVAPMRRLMRAARAVGSGKLDVYVPASSADELGLLTHTFNHMTQRLSESQAEVATYQRTLEDKVAQRTKELEIATAHAYKLAQHDILTGLPNRSLLNQRLKQILAQAQRDGTHVACLFLDFDHFKRINDTLGHDSGDQLLQAVAQRLTAAVRESDTVARLGGDEFVLILPGLDPAARDVRDDDGIGARARVVPRAVSPVRPDADADLLDRRVDVSARRDRSGEPHQAGRHGDVRGEGSRAQRVPLLHRRHERAGPAAAAARNRHAARADGRRVLPRLPAADRDAERARRRRRGAAALARPRARRHLAVRVHPDRRGIRDDPGAGRSRAARRLPAGRRVAPAGDDAAALGQPVGAAAPARQLARRSSTRRCRRAGCPRTISISRSPRA